MRHRTKEPVVLVFTCDIYLFYGNEHRWSHPSIHYINNPMDTKPEAAHRHKQLFARKYDVRYRLEPVFSFYGVFVCRISGCCNMDHQNVSRTVIDRGH